MPIYYAKIPYSTMVSGGVEYYEDGILDDRWIST